MLTINEKYKNNGRMDADSEVFLSKFNEPLTTSILEIGANEEYTANILTENGYQVTGIDLRPYLQKEPCHYVHRIADFCQEAFDYQGIGCIYSLSAIEHFGLSTYNDEVRSYYDVAAMHLAWSILAPNGTCYITVPYGKSHVDYGTGWRVYDKYSLLGRIIQRFKVEEKDFFASGECRIRGQVIHAHALLTQEEADSYDNPAFPHVTVFLKMRKIC